MSLNTAHAHGGVLIFAVERILIYYDGIELQFEGPPGIPQFKGKKKGRIYLTTHRVVFNCSDAKDSMQSFSFPFLQLREVELEQPIFGANYIKGRVLAEQNAMLKAASLASRNRPPQPPPYTPSMVGNIYAAPPPAYQPPQDPYYAWVPYQTFPTAPPDNSVYMTEAPPPYPGINPDMAPYPPMANGHDSKAQEAAASAYYNPANPHYMYASAPPPPSAPAYPGSDPPPAYDQANKKYD
ncbi:hypothetical protein BaRGS_00032927 [Batillaria attramentaria]|uniref:GRAM domain-containing protein n=1 Tax=Batillaria attramentaria TaxID=370345 RepID=A0ABD0JN16_9CAEN